MPRSPNPVWHSAGNFTEKETLRSKELASSNLALGAQLKSLTLDKNFRMEENPLRELIKAVEEIGPRNIPNLAERLKIPVETARHRFKKQLLSRGIKIDTVVDYEKFGLSREYAFLQFNETLEKFHGKLSNILADDAYLVYYNMISPNGLVFAQFTIPRSKQIEHSKLLHDMVARRFLQSYQTVDINWSRHFSNRFDYYNFKNKKWEVDWDKIKTETQIPVPFTSNETEYDEKDLLIVAEMQNNPLVKFEEIAKNFKIDVKTLLYHYHAHVEEREFIRNYVVRWLGNIKRDNPVEIRLWSHKLSEPEVREMQEVVPKIPFVYKDSFSTTSSSYFAASRLPLTDRYLIDMLEYLRKNLRSANRKIEYSVSELSNILAGRIPDHMYNGEEWLFRPGLVLEKLENIRSI